MQPPIDTADLRAGRPGGGTLSVQQLAHELGSLLDGALRCLRLASHRLPAASTDPRAVANLHLARQALDRMAGLLESAMKAGPTDVTLLASGHSLRDAVERVTSLLTPMAEERGVALRSSVEESVAGLPAGLLETVLLNVLRNAVEAAARAGAGEGRVECSVACDDGAVAISVADSGPGPSEIPSASAAGRGPDPSRGHGIGLALCRQITAELGGRLSIASAPYGGGTVLHACVPIEALRRDRA